MPTAWSRSCEGLTPLPWDSRHYGRPVCRIDAPSSMAHLELLLSRTREAGFWLVYFRGDRQLRVPDHLLRRFNGLRVGGHAVFTRWLETLRRERSDSSDSRLVVYRGDPNELSLTRLAIAASAGSRFRTDPRLSGERCDAMYERWIRDCATGAQGDELLVALVDEEPRAITTFGVEKGIAKIGLVSTDGCYRRRGLAAALLDFAHSRILERGVRVVRVVTQSDNVAARRLYTRVGYTLEGEFDYYHFLEP